MRACYSHHGLGDDHRSVVVAVVTAMLAVIAFIVATTVAPLLSGSLCHHIHCRHDGRGYHHHWDMLVPIVLVVVAVVLRVVAVIRVTMASLTKKAVSAVASPPPRLATSNPRPGTCRPRVELPSVLDAPCSPIKASGTDGHQSRTAGLCPMAGIDLASLGQGGGR